MAVFTPVPQSELKHWLSDYSVGELIEYQGISSGIENTNYFVTTSNGEFVLTVFEKLTPDEVDYYLNFMAFVSQHALPCPNPQTNQKGKLHGILCHKPATLVSRLKGKSIVQPTLAHCQAMGELLARLHLVGTTYPINHPNPRGRAWWKTTAPQVLPFLSEEGQKLLEQELTFLLSRSWDQLPTGTVHADLFRDNVLFEETTVSGIIDFYFAGQENLLFDLCVVINDWCMEDTGQLDFERYHTLLKAYHQTRQLTSREIHELPIMLRAAAMRFWLSRLFDKFLPRKGEMIQPHDPMWFQRIIVHYQGNITPCPL